MHLITSFDFTRIMLKDVLKNYSYFEDNLLCVHGVGGGVGGHKVLPLEQRPIVKHPYFDTLFSESSVFL
jgi:hypothetical protein